MLIRFDLPVARDHKQNTAFTLGPLCLSRPSLRYRSHLTGIHSSPFWIKVGRWRGGLCIRRCCWRIAFYLVSWPSITPSSYPPQIEGSEDFLGHHWINTRKMQKLPKQVRAAAAVGLGPRGDRKHNVQEQHMPGNGGRLEWWHHWSSSVESN